MDAIKAIMTRRSVRQYTAQPLEEKVVTELLECAMSAPSAGNEQPWEFVVIRDRGILEQITQVHPYAQMLKQAPAAILVCGDVTREKYEGFWVQDCSAATQNILLAANALGLGAVWLGIHPIEDRMKGIGEIIGLPDTVLPLSLIALGYPAQTLPPAERYDAERVHSDRW